MRYQPQGRIRVDWSNPITRGLEFAWVASAPTLALRSPPEIQGELVFSAAPDGIAATNFRSPSGGSRLVAVPAITGFTGVGTLIAGGVSGGAGAILSIGTSGQGVKLGVYTGKVSLTFLGVADYTTNIDVPSGPVVMGAAIGGGNAVIMARAGAGIQQQSRSVGTPKVTTEPLRIGSTGFTDAWPGSVSVAFYFSRKLSAAELQSLVANPYQLFAAPEEEYEIAAESGGPTDSTGTFASSLASVGMAASGNIINAGSFYSALDGITMLSSGTVANSPVGSFAATLSGVAMSATGSQLNAGQFASTMQGANMAASGAVAQHPSGTFASTLGGATMASYGAVGDDAPADGIVPHRYRWRVMRRHFDN